MEDLPLPATNTVLSVTSAFPRVDNKIQIESSLKEATITSYASYNSQLDGSLSQRFGEFVIHGSPNLINLSNLCLSVKGTICKGDGTAYTIAENVMLTNNTMHSLIKSVTVHLNGTLVESTNNYAYNSMIKQLISLSNDDISRSGECVGLFSLDKFKGETYSDLANLNEKLKNKMNSIKESGFDYYGPLHLDISSTHCYLAPSVEIQIKIDLNDSAFVIGASTDVDRPKYLIKSMTLHVQHLAVRTNASLALEKSMFTGNLCYPFRKFMSKTVLIGANQTMLSCENIYQGVIPACLYFVFLDLNAFSNKSYTTNKLHFHHRDLRNVKITVNNKVAYNIKSKFNHETTELYSTILQSLGGDGQSHLLKYDDWLNGCSVFAFNLNGEMLKGGIHPTMSGANLRLELELDKNDKNLVLYLLGEFQSSFEINHSRQVTLSSVV